MIKTSSAFSKAKSVEIEQLKEQISVYNLNVLGYHINVSIHKRKVCRENNKQCWFPEHWTEKDINSAAQYVLSLKKNQGLGENVPKTGCYKGVKVGLYDAKGKVNTVFPWYNQRRR